MKLIWEINMLMCLEGQGKRIIYQNETVKLSLDKESMKNNRQVKNNLSSRNPDWDNPTGP